MGAVALRAVAVRARGLAAVPLACASGVAQAHAPDLAPAAGWVQGALAWNREAWLLALVALSAALYVLGLARLWRRAGAGHGISRAQAGAFAGGWLALAAALVSPLDALGARLFSAHMVQHELLMVLAAPLLVAGRPLVAWTWALPARWRGPVGRCFAARGWLAVWHAITDPLVAWGLHAVALWAWHVPAFFDAALRGEAWHIVQHVSFLGTALLFWWAVLGPDMRRRPGHALALLFTTMLHTGALGALLTLAPTPWYAEYIPRTGALGLDPVEDQQLGGLVMWVPAGLAYVAAALVLLARLLAAKAPSQAVVASPPVSTAGSSTHSA